HHTRSQRELYVEKYQQCCVFGYLTLRTYANEQATREEMIERLAEVDRMLMRLRMVSEREAVAHEAGPSAPQPQPQDIAEGDDMDLQEEEDRNWEEFNASDEIDDGEHDTQDYEPVQSADAGVRLPSGTRRKRDSEQAMLSEDDESTEVIRGQSGEGRSAEVPPPENRTGGEHVAPAESPTSSGLPTQREGVAQISTETAEAESG
ncbi:hypothetical protein OSTOST_03063, partial [Ostertagia ostertagi]